MIIIYSKKILIHLQSYINNVLFDDITFIKNLLDKKSPIYLLGTLRYFYKECDNIKRVNINNSNVIKHYEYIIHSEK